MMLFALEFTIYLKNLWSGCGKEQRYVNILLDQNCFIALNDQSPWYLL